MDRIGLTTKGLDALEREVLGTPTCTACGACVGFCPRSASGAGLEAVEETVEGRDTRRGLAGDVRYAGPLGHVELGSRRLGIVALPCQATDMNLRALDLGSAAVGG